MANKNTNPGGGKDDNEMRIQFGLILALCQNCAILHTPLFHAQNSNLFKGLSPRFPRFSGEKKSAPFPTRLWPGNLSRRILNMFVLNNVVKNH